MLAQSLACFNVFVYVHVCMCYVCLKHLNVLDSGNKIQGKNRRIKKKILPEWIAKMVLFFREVGESLCDNA